MAVHSRPVIEHDGITELRWMNSIVASALPRDSGSWPASIRSSRRMRLIFGSSSTTRIRATEHWPLGELGSTAYEDPNGIAVRFDGSSGAVAFLSYKADRERITFVLVRGLLPQRVVCEACPSTCSRTHSLRTFDSACHERGAARRVEWCGRGDSNPHDLAIASPSN